MTDTPSPEKSRMTVGSPTVIDADDPSDIQRGIHRRPFLFGDVSIGSAFAIFQQAVDTASNYSGWTTNYDSKLSPTQYNRLISVARSISDRFPIAFEAIRDFLIILTCISTKNDFLRVAEAVELEALYDENLVGKPDLILALPDLYKVAFVANAVDGILKLFSRYLESQGNQSESSSDALDKISSLLGIASMGAGVAARLQAPDSTEALGQFMSELLTGKRIPMTMIAKNPNLQIPTYIGKAFMGESAVALPNIDIKEIFAKKIAAFPQMSNGSGSTMFSMINSKSLQVAQTIESIAGRVMFGSAATDTLGKIKAVADTVDKLGVLTGVSVGETVEMFRADTAIPLLAALSTVQSGLDKQLIPHSVFQQGWTLANNVSQHLSRVDTNYLSAFQKLT